MKTDLCVKIHTSLSSTDNIRHISEASRFPPKNIHRSRPLRSPSDVEKTHSQLYLFPAGLCQCTARRATSQSTERAVAHSLSVHWAGPQIKQGKAVYSSSPTFCTVYIGYLFILELILRFPSLFIPLISGYSFMSPEGNTNLWS